MVINRAKLILELSASGLSQAKSACEAIQDESNEVCKLGQGFVISDGFSSIYKTRAMGLASCQTPYAKQLLVSIRELLANLKEVEVVTICFFVARTKHEHEYVMFVLIDTGKILGCLKMVSKLDVAPERWGEIWGRSMGDEET